MSLPALPITDFHVGIVVGGLAVLAGYYSRPLMNWLFRRRPW